MMAETDLSDIGGAESMMGDHRLGNPDKSRTGSVATIRLTLLYAQALHNIYMRLPGVQLKTVDKATELWYNLANLCSIID